MVVGAAVFSHWLLDLVVHRHDLPLYANEHKVGLGLWNYPATAFALEVVVLLGGMYLYVRNTRSVQRGGNYGLMMIALLMVGIQLMVFFGKPPASDTEVAVSALVSYFLFATMAFWVERKRVTRTMDATHDYA
jgi:hypothetical protein